MPVTSSLDLFADRLGDHHHRDDRDHQDLRLVRDQDRGRDRHQDHRNCDQEHRDDRGHLDRQQDAGHSDDQDHQCPPDHVRWCWQAIDPCARQYHPWDAGHWGDRGHQCAAVGHHQGDGSHREEAESDDRCRAAAELVGHLAPYAVAAVADAAAETALAAADAAVAVQSELQ